MILNPNKILPEITSPLDHKKLGSLADNIKGIFKNVKTKVRALKLSPTVGSLRKALTDIGEGVIKPMPKITKHVPFRGGIV